MLVIVVKYNLTTPFNGYCAKGAPDNGLIDQLSCSYGCTPNRLESVNDGSNSIFGFPGGAGAYTYDEKGNMTNDPYRGVVDVFYNFMNLPYAIEGNGAVTNYLYDASGRKWQKEFIGQGENRKVDYYKDVQYINEEFDAIYHNDGRITKNKAGEWVFEYSLKDHLGNQRIMFSDADGDGEVSILEADDEVLQELHYYPFGMHYDDAPNSPWYKYPNVGKDEKYQYNGKEVQDEVFLTLEGKDIGLGWLDYGARYYDPSVGRFTSVDPLADVMPGWSPYSYTFNNPLKYTDPDGQIPIPVIAGLAGAAIGGGIELVSQLRSGESVDWGSVGTSALKGGATAALISVGGGAVAAAGGLTSVGGVATSAAIGATASGGVEAASQLATTGSIDGESVAVAAVAGGIAAPVGGAVGKKVSEALSTTASSRATEALRTGLSGNAAKAAQKDAVKALGPGATNAQKAVAKRTARAGIKADARAAYGTAQNNIQRNASISQGVGAAGATKTASEGNKSIISRVKNWWNGN